MVLILSSKPIPAPKYQLSHFSYFRSSSFSLTKQVVLQVKKLQYSKRYFYQSDFAISFIITFGWQYIWQITTQVPFAFIHSNIYICVCIYTYAYRNIYTNIHIQEYIHINIQIYILCVYIHTHNSNMTPLLLTLIIWLR